MRNMTEPEHAELGQKIEHDLMPGFPMEIRGVGNCKTDANRSKPHARYLITDPDGNDDWLCAYDVHLIH